MRRLLHIGSKIETILLVAVTSYLLVNLSSNYFPQSQALPTQKITRKQVTTPFFMEHGTMGENPTSAVGVYLGERRVLGNVDAHPSRDGQEAGSVLMDHPRRTTPPHDLLEAYSTVVLEDTNSNSDLYTNTLSRPRVLGHLTVTTRIPAASTVLFRQPLIWSEVEETQTDGGDR